MQKKLLGGWGMVALAFMGISVLMMIYFNGILGWVTFFGSWMMLMIRYYLAHIVWLLAELNAKD